MHKDEHVRAIFFFLFFSPKVPGLTGAVCIWRKMLMMYWLQAQTFCILGYR